MRSPRHADPGFDLGDVGVPVAAWHRLLDPIPAEVIRFVVDSEQSGELVEYPERGAHVPATRLGDWLAAFTTWAR